MPNMQTALSGVEAITLFVEDLAETKRFYEQVLGLAAIFEDDESAAYMFGQTIINLLSSTAARELIEPGVVAAPDGGSRFQMTILVSDVDATCLALAAAGVVLLNGPLNRPWGRRTASFRDPAGNIWEIAQELPRG